MPKGRGAGSRKKRSGRKKEAAAARSGDPLKQVEEATSKLERHQRKRVMRMLDERPGAEIRKRQQAAEAGGFTREERRRSRQREEEAARLAARRMAKAINEQAEK